MLTHTCYHHENCSTQLSLLHDATWEIVFTVSQELSVDGGMNLRDVDGGIKVEEWWEIHNSIPGLYCLPAGPHRAEEQCTTGCLIRFS